MTKTNKAVCIGETATSYLYRYGRHRFEIQRDENNNWLTVQVADGQSYDIRGKCLFLGQVLTFLLSKGAL